MAMKKLLSLLLVLVAWVAQAERPASPFGVSATLGVREGLPVVRVKFEVPADHVLYADKIHFQNDNGDEMPVVKMTAPIIAQDKATGHEKKIYDRAFTAELKMPEQLPLNLVVRFQGCSNSACYFPDKRSFTVDSKGVAAVAVIGPVAEPVQVAKADNVPATADWHKEAGAFKVVTRETGYLKSGDFISFLNKSASGSAVVEDDPLGRYKKFGIVVTLFLIVLGGLGLNLTPCVLPLIPINLAIIGAGKAAHSRKEGFLHGATYGAGMALSYGVLGLAVVLTGAKFGTLNSSIWFNVAIALIFGALSLSMFDVLHIDFTRFDRGLGKQESKAAHRTKSKGLVAFTLGVIAALLAGACVAPVVISVLLLSANLYAQGVVLGLALPFMLGLGMALPWPFMGASLSFLPKPGRWMVRVKHGFGVLIVLFAGYYGWLAFGLYQSQHNSVQRASAPGGGQVIVGANQSLFKALQQAKAEGKPVFVDFQASWCKNCEAMDATVFNQSNVQKRLKNFIVVKYQAERPNESPAKEVLDHFGVMGLPTYVVLAPQQSDSNNKQQN